MAEIPVQRRRSVFQSRRNFFGGRVGGFTQIPVPGTSQAAAAAAPAAAPAVSPLAQIGIDLIRRGAQTQARGIQQQAAAQREQLDFQAAQAQRAGEIDARQAIAQAQAAEFNRETALREAAIVRQETQATLRQEGRAGRLRLGAIRAATGGAGIRRTGSAADILADVATQNRLQAANIRLAGETEAGRLERTAGLEAQRAAFARESAENIRANASLAARRLNLAGQRAVEAGDISVESTLLAGRQQAAFAQEEAQAAARAEQRATRAEQRETARAQVAGGQALASAVAAGRARQQLRRETEAVARTQRLPQRQAALQRPAVRVLRRV